MVGATPHDAPLTQPVPVTLISYARGEAYEASLKLMQVAANSSTLSELMLWTDKELLEDPLCRQNPEWLAKLETLSYQRLRGRMVRPYCLMVKPLMFLRALQRNLGNGGYVLWADASKYFKIRLAGDLQGAVRALNGRSAYSQVHCSSQCVQPNPNCSAVMYAQQWRLVDPVKAARFKDVADPADVMAGYGLLSTNMLWATTPENLRLAEDWLHMAIREPTGFCSGHSQEQGALNILMINRSLPLIDLCPYMRPPWLNRKCYDQTKSVDTLLNMLARRNFNEQFNLTPAPSPARESKCKISGL